VAVRVGRDREGAPCMVSLPSPCLTGTGSDSPRGRMEGSPALWARGTGSPTTCRCVAWCFTPSLAVTEVAFVYRSSTFGVPRLTGRRRSRTDQAWGYYTAQVLKSCVGRATTRAIKRGGPPGPVHATTPATLSGEVAHVPGLTSTPRTVGQEKPRLSDVLAPQPRQCQTTATAGHPHRNRSAS
jgi:hypothetical protein